MGQTEADPRWQAVCARDRSADGQFVHAVLTTGIYCRPSCPSRRPQPQNVRFFDTPSEAHAAGFRACLRCRPDGPSAAEVDAEMVSRACRLIEAAEEPPTLQELAGQIGVSPFHFHRRFKAVTGLTPRDWAAALRARRMREGLNRAQATVTEALHDAGYGSSRGFYERATEVLGMQAKDWKKGGRDARIRFAVAETSLGALLVARSEQGICAITLGDDPEALVRNLQDLFPKAELIGGDAGFEALVAQVVGFVEAPRIGLDLPLDLRGTAFQLRVWQALRQIPAGRTVTYAELAESIGLPKAVRAVASACAANRVAVAVPCHRVIRSDGGLSGYRWGVARKRALITREAEG